MMFLKSSKNILACAVMACFITGINGCAKTPPSAQGPVVINVSSGPATVSTAGNGEQVAQQKGQSASQISPQNYTPPVTQQPAQQNPYQHATLTQQVPAKNVAQSFEHVSMDEASFLNTQIHEIALQLLENFRDEAGPDGPVAVATFVDLNNLYRTSPFGRYIAEQLMGELQRAGFNVVEIRKADSIMVKPRYGEYGLSRDIQELARQSSARYVLAGTYVTKGRYILINARLISNENNMVASSGLKILRKDPFLEKLLWPSASPEMVPAVRVPVKELGSLSEMKIMSGS